MKHDHKAEMTGHLMAELYESKDGLRKSQLSQQEFIARVRSIGRRARSGYGGQLRRDYVLKANREVRG